MTMSDKKKFFKYLDTITLKNEDYFNWDRKKAGKPYRVVKTVLNSKEACLKKCQELLDKMDMIGEAYFIDPDFGPQSKDDLASDSLYFEDIPSGYPKP